MPRTSTSIGNALDALHHALDGLQGADDPVLFNLACAQRAIDAAIREQVRRDRRAGASWADIGADLTISRQAAHERFSALDG